MKTRVLLLACMSFVAISVFHTSAHGQLFRRRYRVVQPTYVPVQVTQPAAAAHQHSGDCSDCDPADCPPKPGTLHCLPTIARRCHYSSTVCKPITGSDPGELEKVNKKNPFYVGCVKIRGTIDVPYICINENEKYCFRELTLEYKCEHGKDCGKCTDEKCVIKTCEVYKRLIECEKTCEMRPRTGQLIVCIRQDGKIDVFIGAGNPDFPEYPSNMAVLVGVDLASLQSSLKVQTTLDALRAGKEELRF